MNEREAYTEYRAGRITRAEWAAVMLAEVWPSMVRDDDGHPRSA